MIHYRRYTPHPALAGHVECYWHLRRSAMPAPAPDRILPDGCTELVFNLRAAMQQSDRAGALHCQPTALLAGQISRHIILQPTGEVEILAVRFKPHGASTFFPFDQAGLTDRNLAADDLGLPWRHLEEQLHELTSTRDRLRLIERTLLAKVCASTPLLLLDAALASLGRSGEASSVQQTARQLSLSPRQLERLFQRHIGLTPRRFARLARFRRIFPALASRHNRWADIAADCGFYDQSHLVREFRDFTGLTPGEYLREADGMGVALLA